MPPIVNRYTRLVGIDHPIVQDGLGPFRTPRLAAAVSNAGGLGTVSMPGMPEDIKAGARTFREHIEECAALTDRPFAVNIPVGVDRLAARCCRSPTCTCARRLRPASGTPRSPGGSPC